MTLRLAPVFRLGNLLAVRSSPEKIPYHLRLPIAETAFQVPRRED